MWLPVRSSAGVPPLTRVHGLELQRDSRLNSVSQQMNLESSSESLLCHREERSEEEEEELCFHRDGCRIIAPTAVRLKQLKREERHLVVVTSFLPRNKFPLPERRKLAEQEDLLRHFLFSPETDGPGGRGYQTVPLPRLTSASCRRITVFTSDLSTLNRRRVLREESARRKHERTSRSSKPPDLNTQKRRR